MQTTMTSFYMMGTLVVKELNVLISIDYIQQLT